MEWIVEAETIDDLVDGQMVICEEIVRCKDCINNILGENYNPLARHKRDCIFKPDNWFCADGEGKTDDA